MTKLPNPNEVTRALRRQGRRWVDEDRNSMSIGCKPCIEFGNCGGIFKPQKSFDCMDDCCRDPQSCKSVCPRNLLEYQLRMREVDTFDLGNIPRHSPLASSNLPTFVPLIYHGKSHKRPLELDAAAIFMHDLYYRRDGSLRCKTRAEIETRFGLAPGTKIVLVGCGPDAPIEAWWGLSARRRELIEFFVSQGLELATSPNYSLFTDIPRFDDLYNIKKVVKAWQEFGQFGQVCALHINARTQRDYERFSEFVFGRPEITNVAFEFGTGAGNASRQPYHRRYLAALGRTAPRPLHLTMVGGINALPTFAITFSSLTYIDTSAFVNAVQRKQLYEGNDGRLTKVHAETAKGEPLDDLLRHNIQVMRSRIERVVSEARSARSANYIAPISRIPERKVFVKAAKPSMSDAVPKSSMHGPRTENVNRR
jgi:hypothetical protein